MNAFSKKKILFLIPTLGGGGAERVLVNLANNLDYNKYEVTIQTIFKAGFNASFLNSDLKFKQGKIKQFKGSTHLLKLLSPRLLYRLIVGKKYDVAISYLEGPSARIVSGCPYTDSKLINWIHCVHKNEKEVYHSFRSMSEAKNCYSRYHANAYVSEKVRDEFLKYFPELQNNNVIYNTNEDDKIRSMISEAINDYDFSGEKTVISVGRLIPVKGYERLINAHSRCIRDGFFHHLLIIGEGEMRQKLQSLADSLGCSETVHLIGFRKNPYKYISKADLYVCSSYSEGFSTAVTEAFVLGKPVVTTRISGATEQCGDNNEYGIVVDNSEDGIYKGLELFLSDKECLNHYAIMACKRGNMFSKKNAVLSVQNMIDFI